MVQKELNFAFIDGANLHKGISELGWKLDYRRFRVWLKVVLSPSNKCSILLKRTNVPITYLDQLSRVIGVQNEKAPDRDGTL